MGRICIVCGMEITEKVVEVNGQALLNEEQCPFCGADGAYILKEGQLLTENLGELDKNTIIILDHAMKLEVFNSDFYKKAAQLSETKEVEELFMALARIEMVHAKIHQKMGGFKEMPVLQNIQYDKYRGDAILLEMAKKREMHAVAYYEKYKKEICNEQIKRIFSVLAQVEGDHTLLTDKS